MRRPIIAGNWKMNNTVGESIELANAVKRSLFDEGSADIVLCPPFTALSDVAEVVSDSNIMLGAQNCHWQESGAYTGEVSPLMLKELGCRYVIAGHSERRLYFGETNKIVNEKVRAILKAGLHPIMCVGERLEEREEAKTFDIVNEHIRGGLKDISADDALKVIIAYEPVWAIGTGKTATPEQAEEVHDFIREKLRELYSGEIAGLMRVQYGGSVKPDNISELMKKPDIDGALVGGASLKSDSFVEIVKGAVN